jgi:hypothetical protein
VCWKSSDLLFTDHVEKIQNYNLRAEKFYCVICSEDWKGIRRNTDDLKVKKKWRPYFIPGLNSQVFHL